MEEIPEPFEEFNGAALSESVLSRDWNLPEEAALFASLDKAAAELDAGKGVLIEQVRDDIRRWAQSSRTFSSGRSFNEG